MNKTLDSHGDLLKYHAFLLTSSVLILVGGTNTAIESQNTLDILLVDYCALIGAYEAYKTYQNAKKYIQLKREIKNLQKQR